MVSRRHPENLIPIYIHVYNLVMGYQYLRSTYIRLLDILQCGCNLVVLTIVIKCNEKASIVAI